MLTCNILVTCSCAHLTALRRDSIGQFKIVFIFTNYLGSAPQILSKSLIEIVKDIVYIGILLSKKFKKENQQPKFN